MSLSWVIIIVLLQLLNCEVYDDWKVYKEPQPKFVMYQSDKLNKHYKKLLGETTPLAKEGLHISVYTERKYGVAQKYKPGWDVHSSWNKNAYDNRVNDYHWGYTSVPDGKDEFGKKKRKVVWWPEHHSGDAIKKAEMEPLKVAWDAFATWGVLDEDGNRIKNMFANDELRTDGLTRKNKFPAAHGDYDNQYQDSYHYNNDHIYSHKSSRVHPHAHNQYHDEDYRKESKSINTDSESINIPTVFVTLISCMFLFVICTIYTGCIGLIAGGIGYKIKDSRQTTKDQSFDEI